MSKPGQKKLLLAFDFDHSLIDENSDVYVTKLAPGGQLPEEITSLYGDDGWTEYMAEIFKYLHRNGCSQEEILTCMSEIPLTKGMKELIDYTHASGHFDHIIISDANSLFIQHILQGFSLTPVIDEVFTNPAVFDDKGCLTLKPYHTQDWCSLSTVNLCKGHILQSFLSKKKEEGVEYSNILYVGDGFNDLCPSLTLHSQDTCLPRIGFKLHSVIDKMEQKNKPVQRSDLKAKVVPWETGLDILTHIQSLNL